MPVGVVGNMGSFTPFASGFSKSPHLHSSVLENFALVQAFDLKPFHPSFHFSSVNDGYYYLFSLFFCRFSKTRRAAIANEHDSSSRRGTGTGIVWLLLKCL
jgi:hypothetical protein